MRLIIVRHGQTEGNINEIAQGRMQDPLNETGIGQAKKVAERLKTERIDVIYSSDLKRAMMTADEIIRFHPDVPVHYVGELAERDYGDFTGKPFKFVNEKQVGSGLERNEYRPPGGESFRDVSKRADAFLDRILQKHKGQTVLFVTHGGIKRTLMGRLMAKTLEEARKANLRNTSISIVNFTDDGHEVMVFNCAKHLD